jgi:hypothetical protein
MKLRFHCMTIRRDGAAAEAAYKSVAKLGHCHLRVTHGNNANCKRIQSVSRKWSIKTNLHLVDIPDGKPQAVCFAQPNPRIT